MTFLNFPHFSVFLVIFHVLKCVFLIFRDFQFSRHIPGPSVCISHFSRFLVISSFFKSSSGCFSFSMIFSFLAIFHVLQWTFLNFPPFSVFLAIFHVLKCVFLIFRDFQFSRHIPGPSVCISHFSRFLVISSFFKSSSGCFSFSMIFSFLAYFTSYMFLNFPPFSVSIQSPTVDISKFSTFFSFLLHISRPKVCISHLFFSFPRHISRPKLCISHFGDFQFSRHIPVLQCAFHFFHVF
ncbi:Uncharacterised protein [Chlamydia abortus]|nr:Uncharacterised protein [Chlamydia abortus]